MTISGLLSCLTLGTEKYKIDRIRKIQRWLPRRKVICIGDSTQSDPEAYGKSRLIPRSTTVLLLIAYQPPGEACRAFPQWIKLVLIRKVTDVAAVGIEEKNEPKRFEKAFDGVPR